MDFRVASDHRGRYFGGVQYAPRKYDLWEKVAGVVVVAVVIWSLFYDHKSKAQTWEPPKEEALERIRYIGAIGERNWPIIQGEKSGRIWYWNAPSNKWEELPHPDVRGK